MAINLIVAAISLLMFGFVLVWLLFPHWRGWIEAPKYQVLRWQEPPTADTPREDPPHEQ